MHRWIVNHWIAYRKLKQPIIGPIFFNIFLNDLFLWLKNSDLHNFADDNTIAVICNNLTSLCQTLEKESESAIDWFENNSMIANPDQFQVLILSKNASDVIHKLRIYDNEIQSNLFKRPPL